MGEIHLAGIDIVIEMEEEVKVAKTTSQLIELLSKLGTRKALEPKQEYVNVTSFIIQQPGGPHLFSLIFVQ